MESYSIVKRMDYTNISVVENSNGEFAVIGQDGHEIVPFGKYAWISGFDSGLARVRTKGIRYMDPTVSVVFDESNNIYGGETLQTYYDNLKANHPEKLSRWGIINSEGVEVLEAKYDEIWNFFGKNRRSTRVELNGNIWVVNFKDLPGSDYFEEYEEEYFEHDDDYFYGSCFGKYAGSFAQDVMGYSDDVIDDAFDGEPDAYWNID